MNAIFDSYPLFRSIREIALSAICSLVLLAIPCRGADSSVTTSEDLGFDVHEGKTNRIARVASPNPANIILMYEGGGGRRVPRQELPEQLKSKYPYDAAKASEYLQNQSRNSLRQDNASPDQLLRQINGAHSQIEMLNRRMVRLQEEIDDLNRQIPNMPRKHSLRVDKSKLIRQQGDLRRQINAMRDQLKILNARLAAQR